MPSVLDVYVESAAAFARSADFKLQHMLRRAGSTEVPYRVMDRVPAATGGGQRAFLHVDLTVVPETFRRVHERYDACINGRAITISRLLYTTARVRRHDPYDGPVIVKTILNHHGWPEFRYGAHRTLPRKAWHSLTSRVFPGRAARVCPEYRVYASIEAVPASVWADRRLMVERFLAGRLQPPIEKYRYDFFFDVELNLRSVHDALLADPESVVSVESVTGVPSEVSEVRRRLNLDFGAIDYFIVDGRAVVIDANKTVGISPSWVARFTPLARHLDRATDRLIEFVRNGAA
jgi:hypothetical protein